MTKITVLALCASSLLLPLASAAWGQDRRPFDPPDGGPRFGEVPRAERGPGRRGGGWRGGGWRGRGAKGGLNRVWRGIARLEESGPALSKDQAKRVVVLVLPWSKKPKMTQDEAKSLEQQLEAVLTSAQKTALGDGPRGFGGRDDGPPRGRGGEGPGGDNGPRGRRPRGEGPAGRMERRGGNQQDESQRQIMRAWMETSNPFYAPTGTAAWKTLPAEFQKDVARRYQQNRTTLESLSRKSR